MGPGRLPFDSVITILLPWRAINGDWLFYIRDVQVWISLKKNQFQVRIYKKITLKINVFFVWYNWINIFPFCFSAVTRRRQLRHFWNTSTSNNSNDGTLCWPVRYAVSHTWRNTSGYGQNGRLRQTTNREFFFRMWWNQSHGNNYFFHWRFQRGGGRGWGKGGVRVGKKDAYFPSPFIITHLNLPYIFIVCHFAVVPLLCAPLICCQPGSVPAIVSVYLTSMLITRNPYLKGPYGHDKQGMVLECYF